MINLRAGIRLLSSSPCSPTGDGLAVLSKQGSVGIVRLNRPESLNSLSSALFNELIAHLKECDSDTSIGAIVLTGNEKAFAGICFISIMTT